MHKNILLSVFVVFFLRGQITPTFVKAQDRVVWGDEEEYDMTSSGSYKKPLLLAGEIHPKKWCHRYFRSLVLGASSLVAGIVVLMLIRHHQKAQQLIDDVDGKPQKISLLPRRARESPQKKANKEHQEPSLVGDAYIKQQREEKLLQLEANLENLYSLYDGP